MGASITNGFQAKTKSHATLQSRRDGAATELQQAYEVVGMAWLPKSVRRKAQAIIDEHLGRAKPAKGAHDVTDGAPVPNIDPAQLARVEAAQACAVKNLAGFEVLAHAALGTITARCERDGAVIARVGFTVKSEVADEATLNVRFRKPRTPQQQAALLRAIDAATAAYEAALREGADEGDDAAA